MSIWNQELTMKVIEEYRIRPALWDTSLPEFKRKNIKIAALKEIADILHVTSEEVEKKIRNLRVQFRRETRKSGGSPSKVCWFGYELLQFLSSNRAAHENESVDMEEEDDDTSQYEEPEAKYVIDPFPTYTATSSSIEGANLSKPTSYPTSVENKRRFDQVDDSSKTNEENVFPCGRNEFPPKSLRNPVLGAADSARNTLHTTFNNKRRFDQIEDDPKTNGQSSFSSTGGREESTQHPFLEFGNTVKPASLPSSLKPRRRFDQAEESPRINGDFQESFSGRDEFTIFGEFVALKLRKCSTARNQRSVVIAQRAINDILFDLELEQYSSHPDSAK